MWCFCVFIKPVTTHKLLLILIVFSFTLLTNTFEVDILHSVSQELIVSHYDQSAGKLNVLLKRSRRVQGFTWKNCILLRLVLLSIRKIIAPTWRQQCVLSRSMFFVPIVQFFFMRHTFMTKSASCLSFMTTHSNIGLRWRQNEYWTPCAEYKS